MGGRGLDGLGGAREGFAALDAEFAFGEFETRLFECEDFVDAASVLCITVCEYVIEINMRIENVQRIGRSQSLCRGGCPSPELYVLA